ncbi:transcriptional regulator [Enterococcus florum]|uniref:Transcriptional regulator n=1 Tax=Enterococcus florum TaxID=2480627 RepID=A0A4P5PGW7_9ENTE|nr:helix-turn-helix transcriptional regulator [Enterococcus florum]GCF94902.1 transcriptional regulator [Enterococcus florum]
MNLNKQIKHFRDREKWSQEELAEKIYVSRQTISNWETGRSYPDVQNLLLLSVLFGVSLDDLVKGDVEMMKQEVERKEMNKWSIVMIVSLVIATVSFGAASSSAGYIFSLVSFLVMFYAAFKLEKLKKNSKIKTYSEILAFMENKEIDQATIEKNRRKDFLIKGLLVIGFAIGGAILTLLGIYLF